MPRKPRKKYTNVSLTLPGNISDALFLEGNVGRQTADFGRRRVHGRVQEQRDQLDYTVVPGEPVGRRRNDLKRTDESQL